MKILLSFLLVVSLSVKADFFGDIGDWFEGAANDTGDWFTTAYDDTSSYISHNPGISILSGLAIVGVTEPLALPWVALGTVTPFILGYRVLGGEVVASNAPEFIATTVSRTETFEMTMMGAGKSVPEHMLTYDISSMFEMGTGKVLSQEVAGTAGKTIADTAITDAATGSFDSQFMNMSKTGVSGTVYEMEDMGATKELTQAMMDTIANDVAESSNARVTSRQLFADLREGRAPESLFRQVSVNSPEEIEMESVSFQDFQEAKFNFDNPSPKLPDTLETGEVWDNPTSFDNPSYQWDNTSMVPNFEMKQLASQKMLKYSVSDALSTQMEKDIDDLVERAAFNESQKTFQQMSQKDALQLAKDVYEFDLKATYSGAASWVTPAEQSIADEIVIDSPFQTPDAYLNPKSPITRVTINETTTTFGKVTPRSIFRITTFGSMLAGAVIGFGISTYETAVNGVDWAKDEAHWMAGAANDTYCWLKHGVYEQCDDALFTNIGLEVEKNKTDNDTFFDAVIPMDGEIFIPQRKPLHD